MIVTRRSQFVVAIGAALLLLASFGRSAFAQAPDVGDLPPLLAMSDWTNSERVLIGDYQQKKVVLVWFFCQ